MVHHGVHHYAFCQDGCWHGSHLHESTNRLIDWKPHRRNSCVGVSNISTILLVGCQYRYLHCLAAHHQVLLPNGLYRRLDSGNTSIYHLSDLCLALLCLPSSILAATALVSCSSSLGGLWGSLFLSFFKKIILGNLGTKRTFIMKPTC